MIQHHHPTIALVGRVNVGKSTLFNRFTGRHSAITSPLEGTTRDVNRATGLWLGREFDFVDTGGLDPIETGEIERQTKAHAWRAIDEADVLVLVVDGKLGLRPEDRQIMKTLRQKNKPIIVAINKTERTSTRLESGVFAALATNESVAVSALTGQGIGDLLDMITAAVPRRRGRPATITAAPKPSIRIGLFGRPNVGKSSLMNAVLGRDEAIVSSQPHTTRDVRTIPFTWRNLNLALVDTAGLRRRAPKGRGLLFKRNLSKIERERELEAIERDAVKRTLASLRYADVACLLFPADEPLLSQDFRLAREIVEHGCALVLIITKWDKLSEQERAGLYDAMDNLSQRLPFLSWVPVVVTSATKSFGLDKVVLTATEVGQRWIQQIPEEKLELVRKSLTNVFAQPTTRIDARNVRIYSIKQIANQPPHLSLHMNTKSLPPPAFLPIVEKQLRKLIDLRGTPLKIDIEKKKLDF